MSTVKDVEVVLNEMNEKFSVTAAFVRAVHVAWRTAVHRDERANRLLHEIT